MPSTQNISKLFRWIVNSHCSCCLFFICQLHEISPLFPFTTGYTFLAEKSVLVLGQRPKPEEKNWKDLLKKKKKPHRGVLEQLHFFFKLVSVSHDSEPAYMMPGWMPVKLSATIFTSFLLLLLLLSIRAIVMGGGWILLNLLNKGLMVGLWLLGHIWENGLW